MGKKIKSATGRYTGMRSPTWVLGNVLVLVQQVRIYAILGMVIQILIPRHLPPAVASFAGIGLLLAVRISVC